MDDDVLKDGYLVDEYGKIIGETRNYDPYSKFGEIMLYEANSFGFISDYIGKHWNILSETDILQDQKLRKSLEAARYESWKRHNITTLIEKYDSMFNDGNFFEIFCHRLYESSLRTKNEVLSSNFTICSISGDHSSGKISH